jgi:translation initiation factor eIF-2B subunit alpha
MLRKHGIPVNLILDSAVGYIIDKIDMVLVGAEVRFVIRKYV